MRTVAVPRSTALLQAYFGATWREECPSAMQSMGADTTEYGGLTPCQDLGHIYTDPDPVRFALEYQ